jgi:hypothetical protein
VVSKGAARSVAAGVLILVELAVIALWRSVLGTSPELRGLVVAAIVTLGVGMGCLVGVILLEIQRRRRSAAAPRRRTTGTSLLGAVSVLQLVGGFTALTVLGAFTSPKGLQVLLATMILSVAVLLLVLGTVRDGTRPTSGTSG